MKRFWNLGYTSASLLPSSSPGPWPSCRRFRLAANGIKSVQTNVPGGTVVDHIG